MCNALGVVLVLVLVPAVFCSCKPADSGSDVSQPGRYKPPVPVPPNPSANEQKVRGEKTYDFFGQVAEAQLLSRYSGPVLVVDFDPQFVVVVTQVQVIAGSPPVTDKGTIALGVHSVARVFGAEGETIVGKTYLFSLWRRLTGGTLWLEVAYIPGHGGNVVTP